MKLKDQLIGYEILLSSFTFYALSYYYLVHYQKGGGVHSFDKKASLHVTHSLGVVLLGSLSLYFNDEYTFRELVPIYFSRGYFLVDLYDCIQRKDWVFTGHALISLLLNIGTQASPIHYSIRSASKGFMTEISSPIYRWWTISKSFPIYVLFYILFIICRLIWVPIFLKQAFEVAGYDWLLYASVGFYVLNVGFFAQMTKILLHYDRTRSSREKKE